MYASAHPLSGIVRELICLGGMQNVVCRAQAKVPVVAIYDPELRVTCDMNINNTLALRNTRLVKTYMQMDVRARQLTFAVKQWAAQRALNEAGKLDLGRLYRY